MSERIECTTVLLDAGGILYIPDHDIATISARRVGITIDDAAIDAAHYYACVAFAPVVLDVDPHQPFWTPYLERYAEALRVPREAQTLLVDALRDEFTRIPIWQRIAPGSIAGLQALQNAGVRLGIVSNHNGTLAMMLRRDGVASTEPENATVAVYTETIIDSEVVGHRKPGAAIFHDALTAMNTTSDECIYVGDMPAIDVVGAQAAGIRPFIMDPFAAHEPNERYTTVRSLSDLATRIALR